MKNLRLLPLSAALLGALCLPLSGCHSNASATTEAKPATTTVAVTRPLLLTGTVNASDSQSVLVPPSNSSPIVLRNFVDEGQVVKTGDVVLRIETQDQSSVSQLRTQAEQSEARAQKDVADLEVKLVEAERALATAKAGLAKAKVDAALPKTQISLLDFDRYLGERERAERDLDVKQQARASAAEAIARRRTDAELELKKLQINIAFTIAQQEQAQVRATRDGVVVHGYSERNGERFDEGSSAWPGNTVGQVMGNGDMRVRAFALEADRHYITVGQPVQLTFDALPGATTKAQIMSIANAPEVRASWGSARYFRVDIDLPKDHGLPLTAGMSVLIEPLAATTGKAPLSAKPPAPAKAAAPKELQIEGEIASRTLLPISPPTIRDVWQYTLGTLVPEGTLLKEGQAVATFQTNDVTNQLATRTSALKEKQSEQAKSRLDHAEAERAAELAVAEAASNAVRAQRKAMQSKELIRRVDYDKLVIERALAEQLAELAVQQRDAQQRARKAETASLNSEIAQQQSAIAELMAGQSRLTVKAARAGMVLYRNQFNGDKFAVGSQVWMGLSVATLADPEQLIVQAKVPEVQAMGVQLGQLARVTVPGANVELSAKVSGLGRTYHGKSRSQPVVVRDVELSFDSVPKGVKPGAAVQVTLLPPKGKL